MFGTLLTNVLQIGTRGKFSLFTVVIAVLCNPYFKDSPYWFSGFLVFLHSTSWFISAFLDYRDELEDGRHNEDEKAQEATVEDEVSGRDPK